MVDINRQTYKYKQTEDRQKNAANVPTCGSTLGRAFNFFWTAAIARPFKTRVTLGWQLSCCWSPSGWFWPCWSCWPPLQCRLCQCQRLWRQSSCLEFHSSHYHRCEHIVNIGSAWKYELEEESLRKYAHLVLKRLMLLRNLWSSCSKTNTLTIARMMEMMMTRRINIAKGTTDPRVEFYLPN